ncbi:hypothetical protein H2201_009406, partial [Coniosporium apollinis]
IAREGCAHLERLGSREVGEPSEGDHSRLLGRVQEKPVEGGLDCRQGSREIDHDGDGSGHPGSGDGGLSDGHGGR